MPSKKHHSRRDKEAVPGAWASRRVEIVSESGIDSGRKTWPVLLLTVKTGASEYRRAFRRWCLAHRLVVRIAGSREDLDVSRPHPVEGDRTVYEVAGGPALGTVMDREYCPDWLVMWTYAVGVGAPRFGSGKPAEKITGVPRSAFLPCPGHGPRPKNKVREFVWHEAGNRWTSLIPDDLTPDQQLGLGREPRITSLQGRVSGDGRITPYVWLLGCRAPLHWNEKELRWVDSESTPDRGRGMSPVLCWEWFGVAYLFWWASRNDRGEDDLLLLDRLRMDLHMIHCWIDCWIDC